MLLSALIALMSLAAICILALLTLSWQIKLVLIAMTALSAIYAVLGYGLLLLPWSCVGLTVNVKNALQLRRKDGALLAGLSARADSVVTPYLTIVNFRSETATLWQRIFLRHLVILPDAIEAESYRQLRVWLRWGQTHKSN